MTMSAGNAIPLTEATLIAKRVIMALAPFCERIEVAGSIRRLKPEVHDIEIVFVPKQTLYVAPVITTTNLFGDSTSIKVGEDEVIRHPGFAEAYRTVCHQNFQGAVGDPSKNKYIKGREIQSGAQVDLFGCRLENWGNIFMIRTGSADFSHMMAKRWNQFGWHSKDGVLIKGGTEKVFAEEEDLFEFLHLVVPPPMHRELTAEGLKPWIR